MQSAMNRVPKQKRIACIRPNLRVCPQGPKRYGHRKEIAKNFAYFEVKDQSFFESYRPQYNNKIGFYKKNCFS